MKIESVDFFYFSMPQVLDIGDGSQDALLVRISAGGLEGWGECEASPLTSIASYVCPMSHGACKPVRYSVEGKDINSVEDIRKIATSVQEHSMDLLQANHTLSGIDIALYDLLGKSKGVPVFDLLRQKKVFPKLPYASQLFGDSPEDTFQKAERTKAAGYRAVKFGWGPFGRGALRTDVAHLYAAREGIGQDAYLMVDAGAVWGEDVSKARRRLAALEEIGAYWLEEPFINGALQPYHDLSLSAPRVSLAGGEGCNSFVQAQAMIAYAGLDFVQIDAGRIGGITPAKRVADFARSRKVTYVNHTFTSHLALSASLQVFAGSESDFLCEYPIELQPLAKAVSQQSILPQGDGLIHVPQGPGLGLSVDTDALREYFVEASILINGKELYVTPRL